MMETKKYTRKRMLTAGILSNMLGLLCIALIYIGPNLAGSTIKYSGTSLLIVFSAVGAGTLFFGVIFLIRNRAGIVLSNDTIIKRTHKVVSMDFATVKSCHYKTVWWKASNSNYDYTYFVIVLSRGEEEVGPKIIGMPMQVLDNGFSIPTVGWNPQDRRELFSRVLTLLQQNNVVIEKRALEKLQKLSG